MATDHAALIAEADRELPHSYQCDIGLVEGGTGKVCGCTCGRDEILRRLADALEEAGKRDWDRALADFHTALGQHEESVPGFGTEALVALRCRLIEEEYKELMLAVEEGNLAETADALIDLIYVCVGALRCFGMPAQALFAEVHRSNMAKIGGARRDDGKFLKPAGWTPPDIAGVLRSAIDAARKGGSDAESR